MNLPAWLRILLWPLSVMYGDIVKLRARLYANGSLKAKRLQTPVISVGNLTVGGTGKTPLVIWLAERLLAEGKRVGILSRGYKGAHGTSDEIALIKFRLRDRVVFGVGADRYAQGLQLEQKSVDVFLLDDGYQHLQLARDVDILLMDATQPMGKQWMLPAGPMREPVSAMERADILVVTRAETIPGTQAAIGKLQGYPVFAAATKLLGFRRFGGGMEMLLAEGIGEGPFYAFSGIGNPRAFAQDLQNWNLNVLKTSEFPDHHRYDARDAHELEQIAKASGAKALITTEKDEQNLAGVNFEELPVFVAVIEFAISQEENLMALIRERLEARSAEA